MSSIRWLHLSDFHAGKDDYAQRRMFDRIIEHVRAKLTAEPAPDLLLLTGDLADKGKLEQYELFHLEFLLPLQDLIGPQIQGRTFLVPGNHDVDRTKNPAFDRKDVADQKGRYFDPTDEGKSLREILDPRFRAFSDTTGDWVSSEAGSFSTVQEIEGIRVGIAGINTAWLSKGEDDRERLTPGKHLLEHALAQLPDCRIRLVLGHHPLSWLIPPERTMISALLGKSSAIYLHGHLHDVWAAPEYGGGHAFLSIQCGAGFQAREGEVWRNGVLWGEVHVEREIVSLQPWTWNPVHQGWTLAADAFPDNHRQGAVWEWDLPDSSKPAVKPLSGTEAPRLEVPKGWSVATLDNLKSHVTTLGSELAVKFFDGAIPNWQVALSLSIPRRQIVRRLTAIFATSDKSDRPTVGLLLGAACEGKTTALLQAAYDIAKENPDWKILRRSDETQSLNPSQLLSLLDAAHAWLIVIDDADNAARGVVSLIEQLPRRARGIVHFLLACRDSDWLSSDASRLPWSQVCSFHQERLSGLEEADATAIVATWGTFGVEGLGKLADVKESQRASSLVAAARREAASPHGAFFGALLQVRFGEDLQNHAYVLLNRLGQRAIPSGGTLQDALALVAAMHSEGLSFLTRPVLAFALGCPENKLRHDVLLPLGEEAAAATSSAFVSTRHRLIAEAVISVLVDVFGEDVDQLYIQMATAAIDAASTGSFVPPNLAVWRYDLADHFFDAGRAELAIKIVGAVLQKEPQNDMTVVKLAQLYRKAGAPEMAIQLVRDFSSKPKLNRGFYYEWGSSEGNYGGHGENAVLAAYSLADQSALIPPHNEHAKQSLAGLGVALDELYRAYNTPSFLRGRAAVAVLGSLLQLDATTKRYFDRYLDESIAQGAPIPNPEEALELLRKSVGEANAFVSSDLVKTRIGDPREFTYNGLARLLLLG